MRNETWRLRPLEAYRARLQGLLRMWGKCRQVKPGFRAIFKLAPAPRARTRPAECEVAQWGFSTQAHHMASVNDLAKEMVEAAGFEVFEGVTKLHLLAASGCYLLAASGCFWLLLAASGCFWLLSSGCFGCFWQLLAASGCFWLLRMCLWAHAAPSDALLRRCLWAYASRARRVV